MQKQLLLDRIVAHLAAEVELLTRAALATHAEATAEENKAEDKYDTRSLEASYLAHGQSKAAEETALALAQFQAMQPREFAHSEPINLGAHLILAAEAGSETHYFLGPRAGGIEVECEGETVVVLTPHSPLGRQLMGKRQGDVVSLTQGGRHVQQYVLAVS